MGGPHHPDVHPNAPASVGVRGSARYHHVPGSIGHIAQLVTHEIAHLRSVATAGKAPPPAPSMRNFEFKPRITFLNESAATSLSGIQFPKEVNTRSVPAPNFLPAPEMNKLHNESWGGKQGGGLSSVPGITVTTFALEFDNLAKQWQSTAAANGAPMYKFLGGDVFLHAHVAVYVQDAYKPVAGDKILHQMFKLIYEHELEHVVDEIDIVTNWLPPAALKEEMVKKYLTDQPIAAQSYSGWIEGGFLSKRVHDYLWVDEHNRRAAARDSAEHYGELNKQIDLLRRKRANPNLKL